MIGFDFWGGQNVRFEFKFNKKDFINMIKIMAIPLEEGEGPFLHTMIYPMFIPANTEKNNKAIFEWISKEDVTTWVRAPYEQHSEINEPVRIPINVEKTLKVLALKSFEDRDEVFFIHDEDKSIQIITDGVPNTQKTLECVREKSTRFDMLLSSEKPGNNVYKGFPYDLEPKTEVILFHGGKIKPNLSGSCDTKFLKALFDDIKKIKSKKETESGIVYRFTIDEDSHSIKVSTEGIDGFFYRIYFADDVKGHGDLYFSNLFEDFMGVLSSDPFKFYTIEKGPLWVIQDTKKTKVRYLIPPAAFSTIESESEQNQD
jgi:hypothetical protein